MLRPPIRKAFADRRGERNNQADHTHGAAALFHRENREKYRLHERQHNSGTGCLDNPAVKSTGKFGANAPTMVPAVKILMAEIKRVRLVNFSIKNAVIGIKIPFVSINDVVSHCALLASILKSFIMCGSAVISSVWFKMATNAPAKRIPTMTERLYGAVLILLFKLIPSFFIV